MKTQKSTQAQQIAEKVLDEKIQVEVDESTALLAQQDAEELAKFIEDNKEEIAANDAKVLAAKIDAETEAKIQAEVARRVYEFTHAQEIAAAEKAAARSARLAEIEKAKKMSEEAALRSAHLTDEEVALIAKSDSANPFAAFAQNAQSLMRKVRSAKSASKREPSVGDIVMKNGVIAKPYSEWKVRVQPSDDQILDIVRRVRAGESKSSVARLYNINPTYVAHIMSGTAKSKLTGIVPVSK